MATVNELMETIEGLRNKVDSVYAERNLILALAAELASQLGYVSGLSKDDDPDIGREWANIVYLDIPCDGECLQLSWHLHENELHDFSRLPAYPHSWDGHTALEKYKRIEKIVGNQTRI